MTYVLAGLGSMAASTVAALEEQLKVAQAEQQRLLDQYNDAEFENPPNRAKQAALEAPLAAANKRVNDLRAELRRMTGTKLREGKVDAGEVTISGKAPTSILPWVVGGLVAVLAIGAATRKKTGIAPT